MASDHIQLLQRMPVFGAVSADALRFILDGSSLRAVREGEAFITQGAEAEAFYVLENGHVEVRRTHEGQDFNLAELGPGDCFGEMALIECRPRNATVVALEDCTALRVPLEVLHALAERDLEQFVLIQMNLAREISRRLREADQKLFEAKLAASELGDGYRWHLA